MLGLCGGCPVFQLFSFHVVVTVHCVNSFVTTGKTSFAQSRDFCREQKRGISAKKPFAERGSRQTRAVGNSQDCRGPASRQTTTLGEVGHFAESPARQKMTFGKMGLCRGPHSRQNQALGKTLPWAHRRDLP